MEAKRGRFT